MTVPSIKEAAGEQAQYVEDSGYSVAVISLSNSVRVSIYDCLRQSNVEISPSQTLQYFQEYFHLLIHGVELSVAETAAMRDLVNQLEKDPAVEL